MESYVGDERDGIYWLTYTNCKGEGLETNCRISRVSEQEGTSNMANLGMHVTRCKGMFLTTRLTDRHQD